MSAPSSSCAPLTSPTSPVPIPRPLHPAWTTPARRIHHLDSSQRGDVYCVYLYTGCIPVYVYTAHHRCIPAVYLARTCSYVRLVYTRYTACIPVYLGVYQSCSFIISDSAHHTNMDSSLLPRKHRTCLSSSRAAQARRLLCSLFEDQGCGARSSRVTDHLIDEHSGTPT